MADAEVSMWRTRSATKEFADRLKRGLSSSGGHDRVHNQKRDGVLLNFSDQEYSIRGMDSVQRR
jgi:hypothetical protein